MFSSLLLETPYLIFVRVDLSGIDSASLISKELQKKFKCSEFGLLYFVIQEPFVH